MRTIHQSLIWKEWHEHKWKLASILAILWVPAVYLIFKSGIDPDLVLVQMMICLAPLAIFIGLGTAAGEQSRRTINFLQALPVPMRQVAVYKIIFGLMTVILPILLTVLLVVALTLIHAWLGLEQNDMLRWLTSVTEHGVSGSAAFEVTLIAAIVTISLFIWSAALGANRKDEVSAGAFALAGMVGWWLLLVVLWSAFFFGLSPMPDTARLVAFAVGTAPAGVTALPGIHEHPYAEDPYAWLFGLISAIAMHTALVVSYVRRFGQVDHKTYSPRGQVVDSSSVDWRPTVWRSPLVALIWKQARESGPLVLLGLTGVVGVSAILLSVASITSNLRVRDIVEVIAITSVAIGFIVAIVVGIGVCLYELGPKLNTFWRSRPIQPDVSFWIRYITGGIILVVGMCLPIAVAYMLAPEVLGYESIENVLIITPVAELAVYSAAVALTCLVRHAVYAAILCLPAVYSGGLLVRWAVPWIDRLGGHSAPSSVWWKSVEWQLLAGLAVTFLLCTTIAWLAYRFDWGRRSRY
jgi:hypothetical protein